MTRYASRATVSPERLLPTIPGMQFIRPVALPLPALTVAALSSAVGCSRSTARRLLRPLAGTRESGGRGALQPLAVAPAALPAVQYRYATAHAAGMGRAGRRWSAADRALLLTTLSTAEIVRRTGRTPRAVRLARMRARRGR